MARSLSGTRRTFFRDVAGTLPRLVGASALGLTLSLSGCKSAPATTEPARDAAVPDASAPTDGGYSGFDQCAAAAVRANVIPANLLFVLDRSGSMNCVPPNGDANEAALCKVDPRKRGDGPSKWQVTADALLDALTQLGSHDSVKVGVSLFPRAGSQCDVSQDPDLELAKAGAAMLDSMSTSLEDVVPDGETPIAGSTILGYAHLADQLRARKLAGNTYLVLITDGNETCKPSELEKLLTEDVPLALNGFGIRTFVVGAPGSEDARALLSKIAYLGGTAVSEDCDHGDDSETANCHRDMTRSTDFAGDLAATLTQIAQSKTLTCEFQVPKNPDGGGVNLSQVNVNFRANPDAEPIAVGRDPGPSGSCQGKEAGWTYSADNSKILLCGTSCDAAEAAPEGSVEIILGCPTYYVPHIN